ncbi:hypothetical protein Trydic_g214 [Trypoxylus dichotomus]
MSADTEAHSMQAPIQQLMPDLTSLSLLHRPAQGLTRTHSMQPDINRDSVEISNFYTGTHLVTQILSEKRLPLTSF